VSEVGISGWDKGGGGELMREGRSGGYVVGIGIRDWNGMGVGIADWIVDCVCWECERLRISAKGSGIRGCVFWDCEGSVCGGSVRGWDDGGA